MAKQIVKLTVNGRATEALVEPRTLLIHFLREELGLKGAHIGCETSHCGACTVDIDGRSVKSCTMFAVQAEGAEIVTVEGLAQGGALHPLQAAFVEHHGLQCGFCTPGMLMRGYRLLQENPSPTEDEVRWGLSGNICRCTGYQNIVKAVQHAAAEMHGRQGGRRMSAATVLTHEQREATLRGIGCSRKRKEDARLIQGKGNYVDDVRLPGMLHGDFVRSPYGHARIKSIDVSKAKALPGVHAVLTANDLKPLNLHYMPTLAGDVQAVLADEKVLFRNQEVAFVIADDRYIAADAVDLIEVEYEALPPLVDPFQAMQPDAPILREDIKDKLTGAHGERRHPNHIFTWEVGDKTAADEAFAQAEVTVKELVSYQRVHPCPLETCACIGDFDKIKGEITDLRHLPGAARGADGRLAALGHPRGQGARDRPRHRRRLRQQGRRLSGLCLRDRRLDRARPAGEVGRGPDGEPLRHRLRPRLPHDRASWPRPRTAGSPACAATCWPTMARSMPAPIRPSTRPASSTSAPAPTTSRRRTSWSTASTPTRRRAASPTAARSG